VGVTRLTSSIYPGPGRLFAVVVLNGEVRFCHVWRSFPKLPAYRLLLTATEGRELLGVAT
jgi:hypothetical protein